MTKTNDTSLEPRNRADLLDDEKKIATITLTKDEKLLLVKFMGTPTWDVLMKVYMKQRALQLAAVGMTYSQNEKDLWFYKGSLKENEHFVKDITKIVNEFNKTQENKPS